MNFFEDLLYYYMVYPLVIRIAIVSILIFFFFNIYLLFSYLIAQMRYQMGKKRKMLNRSTELHRTIKVIVLRKQEISYNDLVLKISKLGASSEKTPVEIVGILMDIYSHNRERFNHFNFLALSRIFELGTYWDHSLSNGNIKTKMKSLDEIIDLKASISESVLATLVYHKNHELRKRARVAQIHLSLHDPFRFFEEEFDKEFTDWDKLKIHNILMSRSVEKIPNFARWIPNIENEELQVLFIFEIGFYKQVENKDFLFDLFKITKSDKVKVEILNTLKILGIDDYKEQLTKYYPVCTEVVQKSVISNLNTESNDKSIIRFYVKAFQDAFETELRVEIGKMIYSSGDIGRRTIEVLERKSNDVDHLIFKHLKNPLLRE